MFYVLIILQSGSIAGNLMIKRQHKDFPSDIFTTLEAAGAEVEIFGEFQFSHVLVALLVFLDFCEVREL